MVEVKVKAKEKTTARVESKTIEAKVVESPKVAPKVAPKPKARISLYSLGRIKISRIQLVLYLEKK